MMKEPPPMSELLKVIHVKTVSPDKRTKQQGGFFIQFLTFDNMNKGDMVRLGYEDEHHYFEVTDIETDGVDLKISAKEVGYWSNHFSRRENLDVRKLIGLRVEPIVDQVLIDKINLESLWC